MTATTDYKLLDSKDGIIYEAEPYEAEALYPAATPDNKEYPGNRRQVLQGAPPQGTVLVKTAGNALMSVDKAMLEQRNVVSAVVPFGKGPGDTIVVLCPYTERLLSTRIPEGVGPGQIMFIRGPPPLMETEVNNAKPTIDDNGQLVESTEYNDLKLAAEHELETRHFGEDAAQKGKKGKDDDSEDDFEMV
ncbi:MAG: hypothetical protein SGARI_006639 [Bacillariaceae sp.]